MKYAQPSYQFEVVYRIEQIKMKFLFFAVTIIFALVASINGAPGLPGLGNLPVPTDLPVDLSSLPLPL